MIKVAICGGIGSGKSTVCEMFAAQGVAVYDSDSRAKALMNESEPLRKAIVEAFGEESYAEGTLNRSYLANRVFASEQQLAQLNAIVHPVVKEDFLRWAEVQEGDYCILESAILFESGFDELVDKTVAVLAPTSLRVERAMKRDDANREQIEARMKAQMSDDELVARSDFAIVNIHLEDVEKDVAELNYRFKMMNNGQSR
ncbi:MAG: dephospho-CoA kinase [Alistipes sp.]|nr:dephospho-CoA kinase [Alistipes sp.]